MVLMKHEIHENWHYNYNTITVFISIFYFQWLSSDNFETVAYLYQNIKRSFADKV